METQQDFKELLELFNEKRVEYMIVGVPPVRIDIMTSITGVTSEKAFSGKVKGKYDDMEVYYISRDDFILNKKAIGRKRDIADLESMGVV